MSNEKPAKMTIGDAARIDRAQLHILRLEEQIKSYRAEMAEVAAAYQIEKQDLVDLKTGEIKRGPTAESK